MAKSDKQRAREKAAQIRRGEIRVYELTCITDGGTVEFIDEGPFPVVDGKAIDQWATRAPTGRRQNLLKQLRKRDDDGFPIWVFALRDAKGALVPITPLLDDKTGLFAHTPDGAPVLVAPTGPKGEKLPVTMPPPVWMMEHQIEMPIPYANPQWIKAHAEHLEARADKHKQGRAQMDAKFEQVKADKAAKAAAPAA